MAGTAENRHKIAWLEFSKLPFMLVVYTRRNNVNHVSTKVSFCFIQFAVQFTRDYSEKLRISKLSRLSADSLSL